MIMENEDGTFYLAIGASGGSRIFPAVFQVILNLDWGMDMSGAIEYGRLHDQLYPIILEADNTIPTEILEVLREKGHNVTGKGLKFCVWHMCLLTRLCFLTVCDINRIASVVQAVTMRDNKIYGMSRVLLFTGHVFIALFTAASDSRKRGVAAGY